MLADSYSQSTAHPATQNADTVTDDGVICHSDYFTHLPASHNPIINEETANDTTARTVQPAQPALVMVQIMRPHTHSRGPVQSV